MATLGVAIYGNPADGAQPPRESTMTISEWFKRYPYDIWGLGYAHGYWGHAPVIDSRSPSWPEYARGYGQGRDDLLQQEG